MSQTKPQTDEQIEYNFARVLRSKEEKEKRKDELKDQKPEEKTLLDTPGNDICILIICHIFHCD